MAYTRITPAKHGTASIDYVLNEDAHNGRERRNEFVTGVNLFNGVPVQEQMSYYWSMADDRMQVQTRRAVISFSEKEFDPDNAEDVRHAGELCRDGLAELFPDRQILVAVQTDGKGGKVHVHGIINNVSMTDHKGLRGVETCYWYLQNGMNEYLRQHGVELDTGEKNKTTQTQTERVFDEDGKYVWKADLRQRVEEARQDATSYADFISRVTQAGVAYDDSKKHNTFTMDEAAYIDHIGEEPKKPLKMRGKTMGEEYTAEALKQHFEQQTQAQRDADRLVAEIMQATAKQSEQEAPTEKTQEPEIEVPKMKTPRRSPERVQRVQKKPQEPERTQKVQKAPQEPERDIEAEEKEQVKVYLRGNVARWMQDDAADDVEEWQFEKE